MFWHHLGSQGISGPKTELIPVIWSVAYYITSQRIFIKCLLWALQHAGHYGADTDAQDVLFWKTFRMRAYDPRPVLSLSIRIWLETFVYMTYCCDRVNKPFSWSLFCKSFLWFEEVIVSSLHIEHMFRCSHSNYLRVHFRYFKEKTEWTLGFPLPRMVPPRKTRLK